jgi:hypothetical protein
MWESRSRLRGAKRGAKAFPIADASVKRRVHGEDAMYLAADKNRYIGAVSTGFGPDGKCLRRKVSGKTKQEVRDKLKAFTRSWMLESSR